MKRFCYSLLFILSCGSATQATSFHWMSEERARDVLTASNMEVDSQIVALLSLEQSMEQTHLDSSLALIEQVLVLIEHHQLTSYLALTYRLQANLFFYKRNYQASIRAYQLAATLERQKGNLLVSAYSIMAIGKSYGFLGRIDSMGAYLEQARPIIYQYGQLHDRASYFYYQSEYQAALGDLPATEQYTDSLVLLAEKMKKTGNLAKAYDQKGLLRYYQKDLPGAIFWLAKARPLLDSMNYIGLLVDNEINQASIFAEIGQIDSAISYYFSALTRAESREDQTNIATIKGLISVLYQRSGNGPESQRYLQESLAQAAQLVPVNKEVFYLTMLEAILESKDEDAYQAILARIEQDEMILQASGQLTWKGLRAIGLYQFEEKYAEALTIFQELAKTSDSLIQDYEPSFLDVHIASCLLALKRPSEALSYLASAERTFTDNSYLRSQTNVYLLMVQAYQQLGEVKMAQQSLNNYDQVLQEEMDSRHAIALQMAETHYRTDQVKQERDQSEREARQTRLLSWLIGSGLLVVAGLSVFLFRSNQHQRRLTEEVVRQRDRNEILLGEVNHRVKNNLQQLSNLLKLQELQTEEGEAKEALRAGYTRMEAMSLLHKQLYRGEDVSRLNLRDYLSRLTHDLLLAYGYRTDQMELRLELTDLDTDVDQGVSLGLIANEWITNAIKYALPTQPYLRVCLEMMDARKARLLIADYGPGLPLTFQPEQSTGYGLQLVYMMAEQLYGNIELHQAQGTEWVLMFPIPTHSSSPHTHKPPSHES
ncbi:MAG: sensor histidine kinase [Bacteroidota bacterium]